MLQKKAALTGMVLAAAIVVAGCGQQAASSPDQAIEMSKAKGTIEQQAQYLIGQAKGFLNSQKYDEAVQVASYVSANFKEFAQEAQQVINEAQQKLKELAEAKVGQAKEEANKAMGDLKNTLGSIGK